MKNERYLVRIEWTHNRYRPLKYTRFEADTLDEAKERTKTFLKNKTGVVEVKFFKLIEII